MLWDASDGDYLDYTNAIVAPSNDLTFWMAPEFASSSSGGFLRLWSGGCRRQDPGRCGLGLALAGVEISKRQRQSHWL
jgi:hypothetical protein